MNIVKELRSLATNSIGDTELQLRRAIGYLKSAYENPHDLPLGLQSLFMEDIEKM